MSTFAAIPLPSPRDWLALFAGRRRRFQISGDSMAPTLRDGDTVLVRPFFDRDPERGDVIVARHPGDGIEVVKRIHRLDERGAAWLVGDNAMLSTDSRSFGWVPSGLLLGQVTAILVTER